MSKRLALLIGSFEQEESGLKELLTEWAAADLLHSVAWVDVTSTIPSPSVSYVEQSEVVTKDLFDLLSSKIWDHVTIIAARVSRLDALPSERFDKELKLLSDIRLAFSSHGKLKLRAVTVSIAETEGVVSSAFNPQWDAHLLQEPMIRIDSAVAAQPLRPDMRVPLIGLLAVTSAGAFRWQSLPLLDDIQDATTGNYKPLRIARSYLRVVNAGRLTDEVLAGAFPASGPWSVPPEANNARAVPPETYVPESLVIDVARKGKFVYSTWTAPASEKPKNVGLMVGIKLFFKEFGEALLSIPKSAIATMKAEAQQWIQNATFGSDSNIALKFNPNDPDIDFNEVADVIRSVKLGDTIDAVGESRPWELLQQTSLGLVDAGRFPSEVEVPKTGTNRLVFTEPSSIGPSPAYENFVLTNSDVALLGITENGDEPVEAMDLQKIRSLQVRLQAVKSSGNPHQPGEGPASGEVMQLSEMIGKDVVASAIAKNGKDNETANASESFSLLRFFLNRRRKKKEKKKARKLERAAAKQEKRRKKEAKSSDDQEVLDDALPGNVDETENIGATDEIANETPTEVVAETEAGLDDAVDISSRQIADLDERLDKWIAGQSNSYLFRIGKNIVNGLTNAERDLVNALEYLATQPKLVNPQTQAKMKFRKWTRRGLFLFFLLMAASVASIVFTPLPILLFALTLAMYGFGFVTRLIFLALELVRSRHRLAQMMTSFDHAFERGRNAANEIVRLAAVYEQFVDWQKIIREVVHVPFGRELAFSSGKTGIHEVTRPPSFVLGLAQPNDQQKMRLYLNARSQTIHTGWLTEIMDLLKSEWSEDYKNARLTGPGDDIQPEADNAPSRSVVGKRPLSDLDVYYPRTDFRVHVLDGKLQKKLVERKSEQIAADLARTPIDSLLGTVEVPGLGSALSGLTVKEFLSGLSSSEVALVPFLPDIFSERHPEYRVSFPEIVLPRQGETVDPLGHLQVEPGTEFTVASWRVELSSAVTPIEALSGYQISDQQPVPALENDGDVIA